MAFRDRHAGAVVEVVLRFPDDHGVVDMTDRGALETSVVLVGEGLYRLEDPWHAHPVNLTDNEEAIGGLAFRDVFLAEDLADGSLRFDRIVRKGNWRVIDWFLGSILRSPHLAPAFAKIEERGGFAEEDPWIGGGWLWIFLPPDTDYDPANDFDEVIKAIPREEILSDYEEWRRRWGVSDGEPT